MHEQINPLPHTDAKKPLREEVRFAKGTGLAGPSMLPVPRPSDPTSPKANNRKLRRVKVDHGS